MHTSCPHCGGTTKKYFSAHDFNQRISELEFDYYRCKECGLIFLDPVPENIQDYYGQAYAAYQVENILKVVTNFDVSKVALVKQYAQGKKLLEIGPGNGSFAYQIKKEGFVVDAIEMDENCCKFLKETIQVHSVTNSNNIAEALSQTEGGYDVIVMWHVLEHLKNPWDVLHALPRALSKNGIVIIAVPNPEAVQFRLLKQYWKHVDAPRHVIFLPVDLLTKEMTKIGLGSVFVSTKDLASSEFNSYPWWLYSLNIFIAENPNSLMSKILKRQSVGRLVYKYLIEKFERVEGKGNAFLAIYKKN